jgi:outer membrane protein TolC
MSATTNAYANGCTRPGFVFTTSFILLLSLLCTQIASAQVKSKTRTTSSYDSTSAVEEKLVQLALNGPLYKESIHRNKINEIELIAAKRNWVNLLTVSANYNDQSFAKSPAVGGYVYPKYFFGITVPLGTILSRTEVKAAKEGVEMGKSIQEQLSRTIRAEVLSKYRQYKAYNELITLQGELVNDVQASLLQTEEKFRKGLAPVETYTAAQRSKNDETARLINLQLEQDLIKIDLERMIGTSLDSVIR